MVNVGLPAIARSLVTLDKGILAIDESIATCNRRFAEHRIAQDAKMRRAWRDVPVTAPGLNEFISGVILYDETIRQTTAKGVPFAKAIAEAQMIPGIKVDAGAKDMPGHSGEKITEGLDGLRERLAEYAQMGARFAKWRAVFSIGDRIPTTACIDANAHSLARYARRRG